MLIFGVDMALIIIVLSINFIIIFIIIIIIEATYVVSKNMQFHFRSILEGSWDI